MTVLLVACGGTIASRPRLDGPGVAASLTGEQVRDRAGLDAARVEVLDAARGASWTFDPDDVAAIARTIVDAASSGRHEGVVVTHGTDTMEETAFLTWLLGGAAASEHCPIVFTGAMHHDAHPDADGPGNLQAAVALAERGGRPGPVIHLAGSTLHPRWATKTNTAAVDTFHAPGYTGDAPAAPPPHGDTIEPRVVQAHSHSGVDSELIGWHLDRGARGIVVEGTGAGNVHRNLVPGIRDALAAGIAVVLTSRCWTGAVSPSYGGDGGGADLAELGCIGGGDLPTHKARLALSVALGCDPDPAAVRRWFAELLEGGGG